MFVVSDWMLWNKTHKTSPQKMHAALCDILGRIQANIGTDINAVTIVTN